MLRDLEKLVAAMVAAGIRYPEAQCEFERRFVEAALRASGGSITRASALTGLHRNMLARKIDQHGLLGKTAAGETPAPRRRRAVKR